LSEAGVVVVGAGLAGLSAAAILCSRGLQVTVIEQESDVGGRLRVIERDGFMLDAGMHCFHYADFGPLGELIDRLSLPVRFLKSENESYLLRGKDRLPVPLDPSSDPSNVPGLTREEAEKIHGWFEKLTAADPDEWNAKSVAEFLAYSGFEQDELISSHAGALCMTLLGSGTEAVSAGLLISQTRSAGHPGFCLSVIEGGPATLLQALSARLSEDGARIVIGSRVQEIKTEEGRAVRLLTSSEELLPAAVIYTGPPGTLPGMVTGEGLPSRLAKACSRPRPVSGIALELGLSESVTDIRGIMIDPAEAVAGRFPSNLDPALAPEGAQMSSWLALVPAGEIEDNKAAGSHIRRLKRIVKRQFPGIEEKVRLERLRVLPLVTGAAPLPKLTSDKKPAVSSRKLSNLFLAGDAVAGRGVMSGTAIASAMEAAQKAAEVRKRRRRSWPAAEKVDAADRDGRLHRSAPAVDAGP